MTSSILTNDFTEEDTGLAYVDRFLQMRDFSEEQLELVQSSRIAQPDSVAAISVGHCSFLLTEDMAKALVQALTKALEVADCE